LAAAGEVVLNQGQQSYLLEGREHGRSTDTSWQSLPLAETNAELAFDREVALGYRLDIPAGTAVRFEPDNRVRFRWFPTEARVWFSGFNQAVMGSLPPRDSK